MRERLYFIVLFVSTFSWNVLANITVSGKVTSNTGEALPALVTVLENKRIKGYCSANEDGSYSVSFDSDSPKVSIRVALLGYETVEMLVTSKTQRIDITLPESLLELKEVVVVADRITQRGDTLTYLVAPFKDAKDRVIGDVIKKMPGLEVSESGKITFNGKTVKNFYIENMDLLEGRYGIATNNISANDVASIQVYQNHQPIRALQNWNPTENVTINLTLKSSARGTFSLNGMTGVGYKPMMWAAEAVAMCFGKKAQTITTYKGNNSGDNVTAEQNNLTGEGSMQFFNRAPLSVVSPGAPGVAQKRYMNNRSNAISTNNILKLDSFTTINLSMSYLDDILRNTGSSTTEQYLPAGDYRWISQKISTKNYVHNLRGTNSFKRNTSNLYVANTLNVNASWDKVHGTSMTTSSFMNSIEKVEQGLDNPSFTIDDRIAVISNSDSRSWKLDLALGWNHRPQTLTVSPASIFDQTNSEVEVSQEYTTDDFRAETTTGMSYKLGKVFVDALAFGNIDIESVSTKMNGFNNEAIALTANKYTYGKGEAGIEPRFSYKLDEFYVEFKLPMNYSIQWLSDRLDSGRDKTWNYLNVSPGCKITYRLGKSWWEFNTSFYCMRNNADRAASGIVMTDYLSFRQYLLDKTMIDKTWYTTLAYHYSNAMAQLFGNASGSWLRSRQNSITGYEYDGLVTVRTVYDQPYVSDRFSLSANINKGLRFWESTLKLSGNYSLYISQQIINRTPVDFKSRYWSTNLMFATAPANWMGAALGFAYGENKSFTEVNKDVALVARQYTGRLDLNFFPVSRMVANFAIENNYTNLTSAERNSLFCDIKLIYKFMRCDAEIEFNNIFNRREFSRVNYDGMNIYRNTYDLRPHNVMIKIRFNIL
ncbi:MAG: carboxypeptidase-like regulatory domain-containing protein [Paramuribaculum sp.]|nr:carboxypeptidase-like regulatory domain-containing protein [Paramuribaculum sp.]